jgi:hypothetical protein
MNGLLWLAGEDMGTVYLREGSRLGLVGGRRYGRGGRGGYLVGEGAIDYGMCKKHQMTNAKRAEG